MTCVTLTSDFGTADGYVGAMKGVIASRCPGATLVDITHDIGAQDVEHAAYVLAQVAPHFPRGTVHVVVVDPGVGTERRPVVAVAAGQYFVGPDNGVFAHVAKSGGRAYEIREPRFVTAQPSATFHGRDVFAPAAAALASGVAADEAGPPCTLTRLPDVDQRRVIHVDHFGNLITNLSPEDGRTGFVLGGCEFTELQRTFADVGRGELVAYVGSAGTVEVAVREGSAAQRLGIGRGALVSERTST